MLVFGRHVARLRRRRRRAYAPTSNTASHDKHEEINSWVSFSFPYEYGASLGGPSGRRSSAKTKRTKYRNHPEQVQKQKKGKRSQPLKAEPKIVKEIQSFVFHGTRILKGLSHG